MRFSLFSKTSFEVDYPDALIEAYCFQSNFYKNYDLLLLKGDRPIRDVNEIGARIKEATLSEAEKRIPDDLPIFKLRLDDFSPRTSSKLDDETKKNYVRELSQVVDELVNIKGGRIGFSRATKILHTLYPKIIPIIDSNLQKEYKRLKNWKHRDWNQILMDYYDNFLVGDTYDNLCSVHSNVSYLGLTKVRVFDILWWSYLKAESLKQKKDIRWTTIRRSQ